MRALSGTAARIAVSSYYAYKLRQPSARAVRDRELKTAIRDVYEANYSCYGVRKMWKAINREYADRFGNIARCTVERLMRQLGIDGVRRRRKRPKTASARAEECPEDLVEREFTAEGPNCLWVADITYIPTQAGWVYTTFILDVFHREIVGWQVTNHMRESLARDALTMALAAKFRAGEDVSGLVHHSDRGVQFRSIRYGETLAESEIVASVGSRGDSYDNAMAEALNSVYKAELIDRREWSGLIEVMAATSKWIGWYNRQRLHSAIGYRPPFEVQAEWTNQGATASVAA
ncbi:MAG: IS3 family transposase [Yaniella sp.]|uniref:Transposase InsO and inactivated derivatives n=6 Tax=Brevibacterium TaxID=1696 RepID=A0A2H1KW21_BREAU|nr:IS3 family transposase [Brevibacterium aurantiacum]MDN6148973.1 IS3 family transposase [Yaniella sp.]SMY03849.1 Transposase InsO and inactivated derivatives [Brevibacterium aurantiacum]